MTAAEKLSTESLIKMPNAEYHAMPGLSSSGLSHLARSPAHYQSYKKEGVAETAAMRLGSAIHALVLEKGIGLVLAPSSSRNTKEYKEFAKEHAGKILLLEDEMENAKRAAEAVYKHETAHRLLTGGEPELSAFWKDPNTGVDCRCRPDYFRNDGLVIDLKSTADASSSEFQRSMSVRKYHWQTAWYLRGLEIVTGRKDLNFVHVVVETSEPYGVNVFAIDEPSLNRAREDIERLLAVYSDCMHTGDWPSYPIGIQNLSLRPWEFQS